MIMFRYLLRLSDTSIFDQGVSFVFIPVLCMAPVAHAYRLNVTCGSSHCWAGILLASHDSEDCGSLLQQC